MFKCTECPQKSFTSKALLENHLQEAHSDLIIVKRMCKYCGWEAQSQKTLQVHLKLIHRDKLLGKDAAVPIEIEEEEVENKEVKKEEEHKDAGAGEKSRVDCSTSTQDDELVSSQAEEQSIQDKDDHHDDDEQDPRELEHEEDWRYECTQCQVVFENPRIYERHMRKHRFVKCRLQSVPIKKKVQI